MAKLELVVLAVLICSLAPMRGLSISNVALEEHTAVNLAFYWNHAVVMCLLSCAKAMICKLINTSLTAVAIQYGAKCKDTDDENYLQQLKLYLDPDAQSILVDETGV